MKVLFVCKANAGRSVTAEALFNKFSKKNRAFSAGTVVKKEKKEGNPAGVNSTKALSRIHIDVSKHRRKQLDYKLFKKVDKVVVLLTTPERGTLPKYLKNSKKVTYWNIKDMRGTDYNFHVKGRARINRLVKALIKKIG